MFKIALANLGKYNEGKLVYQWLQVPFTEEELQEAFDDIGIDEYYEETFISDYDFDEGYELELCEYEDLKFMNEVAEAFDNLSEYDKKKAIAYTQVYTFSNELQALQEGIDHVDDIIFCEADSLEDLAREYEEELGTIPSELLDYIDWESYAKDYYSDWAEVNDGYVLMK